MTNNNPKNPQILEILIQTMKSQPQQTPPKQQS